MADLLFYLLAAGTLACGAGVVTARMPLFSVLSLLGAFLCLAGIYLLAGFQFLAATQLLVYVGAIMVLFLFVIMLLNLGDPEHLGRFAPSTLRGGRLAVAVGAAAGLALLGIAGAGWGQPYVQSEDAAERGLDGLEPLAEVLFGRYVLPFEASSLLLLATMIAVVALAKRERRPGREVEERLGWPWEKGVEQ